MSDHKLALGVREAADALDVGRDQVYELMNSGALPSFKLGARRLIARRDLEDFVARQTGRAPEAAAVP